MGNIRMEEIDIQTAGKLAETVINNMHGVNITEYSADDISNLITCLFTVRRARIQNKLGLVR